MQTWENPEHVKKYRAKTTRQNIREVKKLLQQIAKTKPKVSFVTVKNNIVTIVLNTYVDLRLDLKSNTWRLYETEH